MSEQVYPTEPGWWWALVEGRRRVVEVEHHRVHRLAIIMPNRGLVGIRDPDLYRSTLIGSDVPALRWLAPVASPEAVAGMRRAIEAAATVLDQLGQIPYRLGVDELRAAACAP